MKTLEDAIIEAVAKRELLRLLNNLKGVKVLTGFKTYIVAGVLVLLAALNLMGITIPGVPAVDPGYTVTTILSALGLAFARTGAKTEVAKALDPPPK